MFVECCRTGYCCGYRRDSYFGGVSFQPDEVVPPGVEVIFRDGERFIPVDEDDVCIYLKKLDNGFAECGIHDKKPLTCRLYNCMTVKKAKYVQVIVDELKEKADNGYANTYINKPHVD